MTTNPKPAGTPETESMVAMWRGIVHSYFMEGLVNRDGVAAICDAAFDELGWIDENFPDKQSEE